MIRIVVVDDHAVVRSGLRLLLDAEDDMEVVGDAGNTRDAIFEVRAAKPDVVLLDVVMPGESGIEARPQVLHEAPEAKVLAILGSGLVGRGTLATCDTVFEWEDVRLWSRTQESVDRYLSEEAHKYPHLTIRGTTDVEEAVSGADVIVTGTHARKWLVDDAWVKPGAHIAALGADLKGEQELDPRILQRGRVFVDDIRQCREDGEINVPLSEGLLSSVGRHREWLTEHRAILASMRSRNVAQVQRLVIAHVSLQRFEDDMQTSGNARRRSRAARAMSGRTRT